MNLTFASATPPVVELTQRGNLLTWISDEKLALALPIVCYWTVSAMFFIIDQADLFAQYRIHTPEEVQKRNKCTLREVITEVFKQHVLQTMFGLTLNYFESVEMVGYEAHDMWKLSQKYPFLSSYNIWALYYLVIPAARITFAFFLMDTWQYFLHRYMHVNKALYKRFHSRHHRLYVPYAFGALYNSLAEGFALDTLGAGLSYLVTGLSIRESIVFYTFSTLKTVDDHCGYALPWDPFQIIFPNNSLYHDIHHQSFGIKTNYSQPFFTIWDKLLNTRYHDIDGYVAKQKSLRLKHLAEAKQNDKNAVSSFLDSATLNDQESKDTKKTM
ncbi:hypothetical protein NADFUDRAFT_47871 [Nadsonia fulvescens var. elongata DSM 6958]|uniref:Fatty acid hydroxylase domain-containing protein n=1 Tax=Nadsonia fulvescens var. elongata DSM 6958 TaxID=857566 RepID=A0A1E3PDF7_9ASCO|nr:hypothetical protein NADFUDRAFT_47871 [Nadsonia fulvescens var. elongata DSM 6958]